MADADLGVNLAFWLTIGSTLLCISYGAMNWNKGAEEVIDKDARKWAKTEDKIDEEL